MSEQHRIRLLMGTTGSGKTYKMAELIRAAPRCFLFDLMNAEHFEEWGVLCDRISDALLIAGRCINSKLPFRIRLQIADVEQFNFLCGLLVKAPHGQEIFRDTLIAVDELALFCSPHYLPPQLNNLIRLGRHTNGQFIATTQRPPDIHPFIRSQAKELYLFQMHEPADLDVFRKRLETPERLINLRVGEYILWRPQQLQTKGNSSQGEYSK